MFILWEMEMVDRVGCDLVLLKIAKGGWLIGMIEVLREPMEKL